MKNDRQHTAIHEAGHAVISRVLGLPSGGTTIRSDGDSAGHGIVPDPYAIQARWELEGKHREFATVMRARILSYMAGREAEKECLGICAGGDDNDRYQIDLMLADILQPGSDAARVEGRMRLMARQLVRQHRVKIERVAALLLKCGELSAEQIDVAMKQGGL